MFGLDLSGPKQLDVNEVLQQQARQNRIGTVTPFGTTQYIEDKGGKRNDNRLVTTLSPQQQALLDELQRGQLAGLQTATGALQGGLGGDRARIEQAYMDRAMGLLRPELDRRERAMGQRLANQGLSQAGGAYNREYGRFETGVNEQLGRLAQDAILQGGNEESRQLQMILALMGQGAVQTPEALAPGPVDVLGAHALGAQIDQGQQQFAGGIYGGLLGMGGQLAGMGIMRGAYAQQPKSAPYGYGMG